MGPRPRPDASHRRTPPVHGTLFVAGAVALAAFAILTGFVDIFLPAVTGGERFLLLARLSAALGPAYLFAHIFLHNLGIAALVPGVGLFAASFEPKAANRRAIGIILALAVVATLATATELIVRRGYWAQGVVSGLLLVEASAVLLLAWAGARALRDYVPTRVRAWSWAKPARDLAPYAAISAVALAFGAFVETLYLVETLGL